MSGLTPEQIQDGKRIYCASLNTSDPRGRLLGLEAWGQWVHKHMDGDVVLFALAAAESVGKLEKQCAELNKLLDSRVPLTDDELCSVIEKGSVDNYFNANLMAASCEKSAPALQSLRAQLAARQRELDRQEELEAENCPEDQSWLQTLQAARRERDAAVAQLAAREQERDEAREIARQLHKIHSLCLDKKSVHDYIRFDADREVIASWPSVPPQTTETRG